MAEDTTEGVRLQKVLAAAGVASRRVCENMISEGRVEVNGRLVTEQGMRVDPERDMVRVDGSRIPPPRRHLYLVLNKPRGVVSTMDDPRGPAHPGRPAGRQGAGSTLGQRPAVPRRSAGHRDRGPVDLDQRRRLRPPARAPVVRGAEDLPGRGRGRASARTRSSASGRASPSRTDRSARRRSRWSRRPPRRHWSGSP